MMTGYRNLTEEKEYGKAKDSHLSDEKWSEIQNNENKGGDYNG